MSYAIRCTWKDPYPGSRRIKKAVQYLWYRKPAFEGDMDVWVLTPRAGVETLTPGREITLWHNKPSAEAEKPELAGDGIMEIEIVQVNMIHPALVGPGTVDRGSGDWYEEL